MSADRHEAENLLDELKREVRQHRERGNEAIEISRLTTANRDDLPVRLLERKEGSRRAPPVDRFTLRARRLVHGWHEVRDILPWRLKGM